MFLVAHSNADHPSGARKYSVTEVSLDEHGAKRVLGLTKHVSADIEVEPRLARALDNLDHNFLRKSAAILTLMVDSTGELGLVRAEFLEKCIPGLKKGSGIGQANVKGIGQADVEYVALIVSTEGQKSEKAPDEVWQRVGRMTPFFNHWKARVDYINKMRHTMSMAQLQNVQGNLYGDAMRNVAAGAAAERAGSRGQREVK